MCSGRTGFVEVVQVRFDPAQIRLEQLLQVFFAIHDPTSLNRQGADEGSLRQLMVNADYGLSPAQIAAIAVPTTIVWGSADHQGGSLSDTITNLHHPPVHIIEGARHLTMLAEPQAFARAVEAARLRA